MILKLKKDLEREARDLGLRLSPEFADGDFSVRPPLLPGVAHGLRGTVKIPKYFLAVFSKDELRCVFLHEAAHVKFRHFLKDAVFALFLLSLALVLSWNSVLIFLPSVFAAAVLTLAFHRRFEYEADKFAAERVSAGAMVGVLRELRRRYGEKGLIYRISHPSIEQRIRRLGHD